MTPIQQTPSDAHRLAPYAFAVAFALNLIWVNASEVFRYFAFVMPMMRETLSMVPDVAPMSLPVFLVWGVWDLLIVAAITGATWIYIDRAGVTRSEEHT